MSAPSAKRLQRGSGCCAFLMVRPGSVYATSVRGMRDIPGAWRRAAEGAGLRAPDGTAGPTIFAAMSALAAKTGAINLGQGLPDDTGPAGALETRGTTLPHGPHPTH